MSDALVSAEDGDSKPENACCVCFRDVEIYSIGTCDHPCCFECSTRMRVLCGQNECPFCRQNVAKVSSPTMQFTIGPSHSDGRL